MQGQVYRHKIACGADGTNFFFGKGGTDLAAWVAGGQTRVSGRGLASGRPSASHAIYKKEAAL
jgi:hypothetical protein